jgi:linoleoyl-CoA desaturase
LAEAHVRFAPTSSSAFATEVRRDVKGYFESRGLSDKGDARVWVRAVAVTAMVFLPYGLILGLGLTGWTGLALCFVMGAGMAGMGFALAHDGQHATMSERPFWNRLAGLTFDVMGVSGYFWRLTHNRIHHMFTNMPGLDEDIEVTPIVRMSPAKPRLAIHRFQHVFAFPVYALLTLSWVLMKDYVYLFRRRLGPFEPVPRTKAVVASVLAGKFVNYAWTIVIPCLVLGPTLGQFLAGYLAVHLSASLILSIVFQLAHHVEATAYPTAVDGHSPDTWAVHQLRTTSNFARENRALGWYLAGLNFQIEHHLFPNICSIHYPVIAPLVEACARRNGLPYHCAPSFWAALASHTRRLKQLGARVLPSPTGSVPTA